MESSYISMKEGDSLRCKRALCGVENDCVMFELEDGVCVLSNVDETIPPIFNLVPQAFMKHMPYTDFAPAKELSQATIDRARKNVESLEGKYYGYTPEQIAKARKFVLRDFPEE